MDHLGDPINLANPVNWSHPLNRGRVGWWIGLPPRDGGLGYYDLCGLNHGTLNGGLAWGGTSRPGGYSELRGDGTAKYVDCGNGPAIGVTSNMSFACSVKLNATGTFVFAGKDASSGGRAWDLDTTGSGARFYVNGGSNGIANGGTSLLANTWYRLVGTYRNNGGVNGTLTVYINGIGDGGATTGDTSVPTATAALRLGSRSYSGFEQYVNGSYDDFTLWNRELTAAEVAADYELSRTGYPGVLNRVDISASLDMTSGAGPPIWNKTAVANAVWIAQASDNIVTRVRTAAANAVWTCSAGLGHTYSVSASSTIRFATSSIHTSPIAVSASTSAAWAVTSSRTVVHAVVWLVSASVPLRLAVSAGGIVNHTYKVGAIANLSFLAIANSVFDYHLINVASQVNVAWTARSSDNIVTRVRTAAANAVWVVTGAENRDVHGSATANWVGTPSDTSNQFPHKTATANLVLTVSAGATKGFRGSAASVGLNFTCSASAFIQMSSGGGVPGGDQLHGLRTVLMGGLTGDYPNSYAETPPGLLLIANGIDPMVRWDGLSALASNAGVAQPTQAIALGGTGVGTISGTYVAYQRFLDKDRNPSNLSPVSNKVTMGTDGLITRLTYVPTTGVVTITSPAHGRTTNDVVVIQGVQGVPIVNGQHAVTVVDANTFTLQGLVLTGGSYTMGGSWTYGIASVVYSNVQKPTDARVVTRQILRNLDGTGDTFYVDVETADLLSTTFASTNSDESLAGGEAVPWMFADETPMAYRYGVPPSHKSVVASHLGRIFAAAEVTYSAGHVTLSFGSTVVPGTGTAWPASFAGRRLYVTGGTSALDILAVDPSGQTLTLATPYLGVNADFVQYAIRPPPAERRLVYYSEPGSPEAWPAWNAIAVPEDSDEIVGLMVKGSFLYVMERRHIYRFTFQADPAKDGFLFLSAQRGVLNNRCWVQVEDQAYCLDEAGIHKFNGGQSSEAISTSIQPIFQQGGLNSFEVNWGADQRLWHAAHDPVRETIRWFVAMNGARQPQNAICYDYRLNRWWIEQYALAVTASTVGTIGYRRSIGGSEGRRVLCLGEGTSDLANPSVLSRGTATGASPVQIVDSGASFPAGLAGAPVSIVSGSGAGQQRIITGNTATTIDVDRPFLVSIDATSVYQVGGIEWSWQSGWYRHVEDEYDNPRDLELIYQPTSTPAVTSVQLFYDHATSPAVWQYGVSQDGVTTSQGSSIISVSMATPTGYARQSITGHRERNAPGDRYLSVQLSGVQASELVRIYQAAIRGVEENGVRD